MNPLLEVLCNEINKLKKALTTTGTDYTATVTKVEGDTAYVQMSGSDISDTPVALSINADVGDTVRVRVANGKAWITGNDTLPPSNDKKAVATKMMKNMSDRDDDIIIDFGKMEFIGNTLVVDSDNFKLDEDGNAKFGGDLEAASGTFKGDLSAAGGTFSGNLNAAGGTFNGTLSAASGSFNGSIESRNAWGSTVYSYVNINNGIIAIHDTQLSGGSAYVNSMSGSAVYSGQDSVQGLNIQAPGEVCIGGSNTKSDVYVIPDAKFSRSLTVVGTKSRLVDTSNYENRLLYCYETPTPYFGDIGTGCTDENGETVIGIDDIFDETINASVEYCVFLQKESQGDIWVDAKEHCYFVVKGTPNTKFSWELKAVQKDYEYLRLDDETIEKFDYSAEEDVGLSMEDDLAALDSEELFDEELLLEVSV